MTFDALYVMCVCFIDWRGSGDQCRGESLNVRRGESLSERRGERLNVRRGERLNVRRGESLSERRGERLNVRRGERLCGVAGMFERASRGKIVQCGGNVLSLLRCDWSKWVT